MILYEVFILISYYVFSFSNSKINKMCIFIIQLQTQFFNFDT